MKNQMIRLAKNMVLYGLGASLNRMLSVLLLPFMTTYLTPYDYGIVAILSIVSVFITTVFSLGLGSVIGAYYFDEKSDLHHGKVIWTATIILLATAAFLMLVALPISPFLCRLLFGNETHTRLVALTIFTGALNIVIVPRILYSQFEEKIFSYQAIITGSSLLTTGFVLGFVIFLGRGIAGMVEGSAIAQLISVILILTLAPSPKFSIAPSVGKTITKAGLGMVPAFAVLFLLSQSPRYLIQRISGLEATGLFNIAVSFASPLAIVLGAFARAWSPFFMSFTNRQDEAKALFGRILLYFIYGFGTLTLLAVLFGRAGLLILTTPAFHEAYKTMAWAAGIHIFTGIYSIMLPPLYFAKDVPKISYIQAITALLSIAASIPLIKYLGIRGNGAALSSGYLIMAAVAFTWIKVNKDKYLDIIIPWKRILLFAPVFLLTTALASVTRDWGLGRELGTATVISLGICLLTYNLLTPYEKRIGWQLGGRFIGKFIKPAPDKS